MINFEWQADAACKSIGTEIFYSSEHAPNQVPFASLAKVCGACPVKSECLNHAVKHEEFGYWGGVSESGIRHLRKRRGIRLETI